MDHHVQYKMSSSLEQVCVCACVYMCVCVYVCVHVCSLVSTPHSPIDVGSVLKLAMAFNGTLFPVIAENIKVSHHSHVECISNDLPCLSIGGVVFFHCHWART